MPQGIIKKSSGARPGAKTKPNQTRPGKRTIAPKKPTLVMHQKIAKKHTAGLIAKTEKTLAAKAGHLELLKGGKREGRIGGEKRKGGDAAAAAVAEKK